MPNSPIIVHLHLFKNAGTTVDDVLKAYFGWRWRNFDHDDPRGIVGTDHLIRMRKESPEIRAISSHQVNPPLPAQSEFAHLPIVLLRHPLARLGSVYRFDVARGPVTPAAEIAAKHDFVGYVREMVHQLNGTVINFHVRALSGSRAIKVRTKRLPPILEALDLAKQAMESMPFVGTVERMDAARLEYQQLIRSLGFRDFVFGDVHSNPTAGAPQPISTLRDALVAEIGADLVELYEERNSADLELYDWAKKRWSRSTNRG